MKVGKAFEDMFRDKFGRSPSQDELKVLIDQSVSSFNQSGGITAHTVNLGYQPRRLNDEQKQIISHAAHKETGSVTIATLDNANEPFLGRDLIGALTNAGWDIPAVMRTQTSVEFPSPLHVAVHYPGTAANCLVHSLLKAGLEVTSDESGHAGPPCTATIYISPLE